VQDDSQDDGNGCREGVDKFGCEVRRKLVEKHKLIIVMVGLPGRGKTFLCNKLCSYLNWCASFLTPYP
jgi:6-phosphofructo-2-kinase/fructose-2,6-biphosphatase